MPDTARPPQRPSPAPPAPASPALASPTVVARARRMLTGGSPRGAGRGRRTGGADRAARLPAGDRLDRVVEGRVDEYRRQGRAGRHALEAAEGSLTYEALDGAANRLARFLRRRRVGAGDRVAVLLARPTDALTAQLALTKVGAVWVPLDAGLPDRSLAAVLAGSGAGLVITTAAAAPRLALSDVDAIYLDRVAARVAAEDARRPTAAERGTDPEAPAYVVVHADASAHGAALGLRAPAVGHPAVTNLVRVAAAVLDIGDTDRVHHEPHTGSDLAVLETWLPWACGATVVTAPAGADLRGPALGRFLAERGITVLRADPARLAGIDVDLPRLRLLVLTGPDRPHDVVARWQRPGRRLVGLHGPPEATVAAFWSELTRPGPDRDATWGRPLPTYGVVVLDPDDPRRLLGPGAVGELGVTGPGVARGYVGREDLTREAFVDGAAAGPVFRTGELGRLTRGGEVERITRLDRAGGRGARVRPLRVPDPPRGRPPNRPARTSVMRLPDAPPAGRPGGRRPPTPPTGLAAPTVAMPGRPATPPPRAPATPAAPTPAVPAAAVALLATVLAEVLGRDEVPPDAHFFDDLGADSLVMARFCAKVRKHPELPAASMQDVYQHPTLAGLAAALAPAPAAPGVSSGARARLAALLGGVIGRDEVPPDAHFFDDLGADSLVMARFCAQVRKQPDLPAVAMQDVYQHPTLASLATALGAGTEPAPGSPPDDRPEETHGPRAGTAAFVLCGLAQLACFVAYAFVTALFAVWAFAWTTTAPDVVALYLRALAVGVVAFAGPAALAVVAKWTLIGRWRPGSIRVWSLGYLRFWLVKTLVRTSPVVLFAGTPIHTAYLRLLGARIGPGAVLLPRQTPVCTDLISVGAGTIVRKDAVIAGYRAHDGRIEIGGVSLGDGVVVGESTVLDVRTSLGDGASLHHGSSLHPGQSVPAGEAWHGSPGRRADAAPPAVPPAECRARRRVLYGVLDLALSLLVLAPLGVVVLVTLYRAFPAVASLLEPAAGALVAPEVVLRILALTAALYAGALLLGLLIVSTVPRLLGLMLTADRVYPLYGPHYWLHQAVVGMTNVKPFVELFGDSSAIAHYLSAVGYRLRPLTQTGSNFGMAVKHENPFLTTVGANTVIADGLSVMNAEYSATSFRLSHTTIGANNFLGNRIAYPPQGRTGDDCLLGTKVAVPVAGPVLTGVGLLGSPSFTIPRGVARDSDLEIADPAALAASLRRKNRHNGVSMALHVLVRWLFLVLSAFLVVAVASLPIRAGAGEVVVVEIGLLLLTVLWFSAVERGLSRLKAWAPDGCSIYDPAFWRHERYWKVPAPDWMQLFNGTPFKAWVWRLLGVRIGARVFDDGANLTEKAFTTIGDDATLGEGAVLQCHSQEDGAFKSDHVVIGARVTLGVGSFVHYGTTIGDDAVLAPDTFLMKGEEVPSGERWGGNPARPL